MKLVWKRHLSPSHIERLDSSPSLVRTHSSVFFQRSVYNSSLFVYDPKNNFSHPVGSLKRTSIFFISTCRVYHRSQARSFSFFGEVLRRYSRDQTKYRRRVSNGKSYKIDRRKGNYIWFCYCCWFYRLGRDPIYDCIWRWWEAEACQIYSDICSRMTHPPPRFFRARRCYSELYF